MRDSASSLAQAVTDSGRASFLKGDAGWGGQGDDGVALEAAGDQPGCGAGRGELITGGVGDPFERVQCGGFGSQVAVWVLGHGVLAGLVDLERGP